MLESLAWDDLFTSNKKVLQTLPIPDAITEEKTCDFKTKVISIAKKNKFLVNSKCYNSLVVAVGGGGGCC